MLHHLLAGAYEKAVLYHVDPKIFAILYLLHYAVLWPTCAYIYVSYRKGRHISNLVYFAIFVLISPWFYPLFFGQLPPLFKVGLVAAMVMIAVHGYHIIQKKLALERAKLDAAAVAKAKEPV